MADHNDLELIKKAFRENDSETVAAVLERNSELKQRINEPMGEFDAPAVNCVKSGEMLDVLLAAGANVDARSSWWAGGFGLLDLAEPELAKYAITRGATVTAHAAARLGMLNKLKELTEADPELVNSRGGDGQAPLHFAATVEIAEFLLDNGAEIDMRDIDHESTPAQYMVRNRQEVARYLVERGAKTDILMASALGDLHFVKMVLDNDPEAIRTRVSDQYFPMIGGKSGGTIYQWELGWYVSAHQVAREFNHPEVFNLLMDRSPDDVKLVAACWLGDEAAVNSILERAPHLGKSLPVEEQRQVAHAARNNNLNAVRLMLLAGMPVSATGQHAATTLHWACWNGNSEMVKLVLGYGPELDNRANDYEGTPMDWAIHASQHGWDPAGDFAGTIEELIAAGASLPKQISGRADVREVLARHGVAEAV
jgi:hypothetical protein